MLEAQSQENKIPNPILRFFSAFPLGLRVLLVFILLSSILVSFNFKLNQKNPNTTVSQTTTNFDTELSLEDNWKEGKVSTSQYALDFLRLQDGQSSLHIPANFFQNQDIDQLNHTLKITGWYLKYGQRESKEYRDFIQLYNKIINPILEGLPLSDGERLRPLFAPDFAQLTQPFSRLHFQSLLNVDAQSTCEGEEIRGVCFLMSPFDALGLRHELFYQSEIENSDRMLSLIKEATSESLADFDRAGFDQSKVYFLAQTSPFVNRDGLGDYTTLAGAALWPGDEYCVVNIYFPAIGLVDSLQNSAFKQSIAHELAHCVQYINYQNQMSVDLAFSSWWVEGIAEFLSDWVYPEYNYEDRFNDYFDTVSEFKPILQFDYPNYIFFQSMYLNSGGDIDSIKAFIEAMPISGDKSDQLRALSEYINVEEDFEITLKNYVTNKHQDTSLAFKSFDPTFYDSYSISRPIEFTVGSYPFQYKRAKLDIQPTTLALVARIEDIEGIGNLHFWDENEEIWKNEISIERLSINNASCGEENPSKSYRIAIANTMPQPDLYEAKIIITTNDGSTVPEAEDIDTKLIGNWQFETVDNADTRTKINNIFTSIFATQNIAANYETNINEGYICFFGNGVYTVSGKSEQMANYTGSAGGVSITAQIIDSNQFKAVGNWKVENSQLVYYNIESQNTNVTRTIIPLFGREETIENVTTDDEPEVRFNYRVQDDQFTTDIGETLNVPISLPQVGKKIS